MKQMEVNEFFWHRMPKEGRYTPHVRVFEFEYHDELSSAASQIPEEGLETGFIVCMRHDPDYETGEWSGPHNWISPSGEVVPRHEIQDDNWRETWDQRRVYVHPPTVGSLYSIVRRNIDRLDLPWEIVKDVVQEIKEDYPEMDWENHHYPREVNRAVAAAAMMKAQSRL